VSEEAGRAGPRLSICIPTHDGRAATLEEALRSVLDQVDPDRAGEVEVCVSDNASEDGTAALVERTAADASVAVRYRRNPTDLGPAVNTLAAVEIASGDYCWILSSDDLLADGAVARVLDLLREHPGLGGLTTDMVVFSPSGNELPRGLVDLGPLAREPCVLEGTERILVELGARLSGISLHVFDRALWSGIARSHRARALGGHGLFAHAVVLAEIASAAPRWLWCPEPLVRYRQAERPEGLHATRWITRFVADLSRAVRPHLDEPAYRRAFGPFAAGVFAPTTILVLRRDRDHGWRAQLELARLMLARFSWIDGFWSESVPALLMPLFAIRSFGAVLRAARMAMRGYGRALGRTPFRATVVVRSQAFLADGLQLLDVEIENRGLPLRTWWPFAPLYVAYRWGPTESNSKAYTLQPARIAPVVRRGQGRTVSLRMHTPREPGRHRLTVGLVWSGIWLDELDPRLGWSGTVDVRPAP
jgi:glycosyltransferase involved in cell wall biosynthesis